MLQFATISTTWNLRALLRETLKDEVGNLENFRRENSLITSNSDDGNLGRRKLIDRNKNTDFASTIAIS